MGRLRGDARHYLPLPDPADVRQARCADQPPEDEIKLYIRTEKEWDAALGHGIWFNRGAIASQKFAEEFLNHPPKNINDPKDPTVVWLSRGLLEACLGYIDETPRGDGLRVAAYEFTYPPVLEALKRALDRGVDVKIVYHHTSDRGDWPQRNRHRGSRSTPVYDQQHHSSVAPR